MALEGSLRDMSLVDLCRIFQIGSKTGSLLLTGGSERGVIYVRDGRLIDATLTRGTERQVIAEGEEAVLLLLQWEDATFTFQPDPTLTDRPARITRDNEWLMLESIRRYGGPVRARDRQRVTLDTRLELAALPSSAESGIDLGLDQWRILSQLTVSQDVRDICKKTGMDPAQAIRVVTELLMIGLVAIVPPAEAPHKEDIALTEHKLPIAPAAADTLPGNTIVMPAPGAGLLKALLRRIRGI